MLAFLACQVSGVSNASCMLASNRGPSIPFANAGDTARPSPTAPLYESSMHDSCCVMPGSIHTSWTLAT